MKLTKKEAAQFGIHAEPKKESGKRNENTGANNPPRKVDDKGAAFDALCKAHSLPAPVHEYPFASWEGGGTFKDNLETKRTCLHAGQIFSCRHCGAKRRHWKFDFIFEGEVAVEVVGGIWSHGHHSGGQDQLEDMARRNEAQILGYIVLEFTPDQIYKTGEAFIVIKRALEAR